MSGFPYDANPLLQLFADLGIACAYRRVLVPAGTVGGSLNRQQPTGATGAEWSGPEQTTVDSTVNADTGMAGGFAPAITIPIIFRAPGVFSQAIRSMFGLQLQETQDYVYLLATDITPSRGDLIDHPNGTQYVIGQEQRAVGLSDRPIAFACAVEHRAANSVTAGY